MNLSTTCRRAIESDLRHLEEIEQQASTLFKNTEYQEEVFQKTLPILLLQQQLEEELLWVAADTQNIPIGFSLAIGCGSTTAHLHEISVLPTFGNRGVGSKLLRYLVQDLRDRSFQRITLSTFKTIPWNAPFYEKKGFQIIEASHLSQFLLNIQEEEKVAGLPIRDRVFMELCLKNPRQ